LRNENKGLTSLKSWIIENYDNGFSYNTKKQYRNSQQLDREEFDKLWKKTLSFRNAISTLKVLPTYMESKVYDDTQTLAEKFNKFGIKSNFTNAVELFGKRISINPTGSNVTFYNYGRQLSDIELEVLAYTFRAEYPSEYYVKIIETIHYDNEDDSYILPIYNIKEPEDIIPLFYPQQTDIKTLENYDVISVSFEESWSDEKAKKFVFDNTGEKEDDIFVSKGESLIAVSEKEYRNNGVLRLYKDELNEFFKKEKPQFLYLARHHKMRFDTLELADLKKEKNRVMREVEPYAKKDVKKIFKFAKKMIKKLLER
jgi:hypothetical protein